LQTVPENSDIRLMTARRSNNLIVKADQPLPRFDHATDRLCGVDEAGRGPLAGPVYAAAVILDPARPIAGLRDSKKLSPARRDQLADAIRRDALSWAIAQASESEIDSLNILHASMLAMSRAIEALYQRPALALIDGNRCPVIDIECLAIIAGDDRVAAISAASILAKTARDAACSNCIKTIHATRLTNIRAIRLHSIWHAYGSTGCPRYIGAHSGRCVTNSTHKLRKQKGN
jgi:ribonuclease HII